ncbi:MAG: ABC transporter substrate-binding protein [Halobacteriaceae archaeon]
MSEDTNTRGSLNRRQFVKLASAAAATGATASAGCLGLGGDGGAAGQVDIPDDPDGAVDGMSITHAMDQGHNTNPFDWFSDEIESDTGVSLGGIQGFSFTGLYSNLVTEFSSGETSFDLFSFYPQFLGEFAANGHAVPLDNMMEVEGWGPNFSDLMDPFRTMYTQWDGSTYALPIDGDVLMLVYRKDLFEQHNKEVPQTWQEFNEVARYFTEETDDIPYGAATFGKRGFSYGWFLTRFGGAGGIYFDADMNPQINTEAGRMALESWKETLEYADPNSPSYGYAELRDAFLNERAAMVVQWTDVPKKAAASDTVADAWGGAAVPGFAGKTAASSMPVGRVLGVSNYISDERKLAAYRFGQAFSSSKYSQHMVSDPDCGEDPYRASHFENPEVFTQTNPYRDGTPQSSIAFSSMEKAEEYTSAVQSTLQQGYPVPYWPGAQNYIEALDVEISKFVSGQQGVDATLSSIEDEWNSIVDDLGREQQRDYYQNVISAWKNAGIWSS